MFLFVFLILFIKTDKYNLAIKTVLNHLKIQKDEATTENITDIAKKIISEDYSERSIENVCYFLLLLNEMRILSIIKEKERTFIPSLLWVINEAYKKIKKSNICDCDVRMFLLCQELLVKNSFNNYICKIYAFLLIKMLKNYSEMNDYINFKVLKQVFEKLNSTTKRQILEFFPKLHSMC